MIGRLLFFLLFPLITFQAKSQHLIGLTREKVIETLKESNFVIDNTSKNTTYNYLKYVDRNEEKTLLVFFTKEDLCSSTKLMCDYSSIKETIAKYNKIYKKKSSLVWNYQKDGKTFNVELRKEEWFYSVIITPKSK
jgi:hypothetical protein